MDTTETTYFETNAQEILKNVGMTKAAFAEKMGVKPQNVKKVFETKNVITLIKASEILNTPLEVLISGQQPNATASIDGFVEVNGITYRLRNREDIEAVLSLIS